MPNNSCPIHDAEPDLSQGNHVHIYVNRSGPDDPGPTATRDGLVGSTIRAATNGVNAAASGISRLSRAVSEHENDAFPGASPPPSKKPAFAKPKARAATDERELTGATWPLLGAKRKVTTEDEDDPNAYEGAPQTSSRVVGELPPLGPDQHYEVESRGDQYVVLVCPGPDPNTELMMGDSGPRDPTLRKMNDAARKFWRGKTGDAEFTVFTHFPAPNERLELRGPDDFGNYALVLIDDDGESLIGNQPLGGEADAPLLRSPGAVPPETNRAADKRGSTNWYGAQARQRDAAKLKMMNAAARKLWTPQGRAR